MRKLKYILIIFITLVSNLFSQVLQPPSLTSPSSGSSFTNPPTFAWSQVSGNAGYRVGISSSLNMSEPLLIARTVGLNSTSWAPSSSEWNALTPGQTYYWSVATFSSGGQIGNWATSRSISRQNSTTINMNVSPSSISFGTIGIGQTSSQTLSITNQSSSNANLGITAGANLTSPFSISPQGSFTLSSGQSKTYTVTFSPTSATSYSQNLQIQNNSTNKSNPYNVSLSGTGGTTVNMDVSSSSINFGTVGLGQTSSQTLTVTNQSSSNANLGITAGVNLTSPFSISPQGSFTLSSGQSKIYTVKFSPTSAGSFSQTLQINNNSTNKSNPYNISLGGTGGTTINMDVSTPKISFGTIGIGQTSSQTLSITNQSSSNANLGITAGANLTSPFSISPQGSFTLSPGQSKTYTVTFSPASAGSFSQTLQIQNNSTNKSNSYNVALDGTSGTTTVNMKITTSKLIYKPSEQIVFQITVKDNNNNPISGISVGVYDPFSAVCTYTNLTNSNGYVEYIKTGINKMGYYTFGFVYNNILSNYSFEVDDGLAYHDTPYMSYYNRNGSFPSGQNNVGIQPITDIFSNTIVETITDPSVIFTSLACAGASVGTIVSSGAFLPVATIACGWAVEATQLTFCINLGKNIMLKSVDLMSVSESEKNNMRETINRMSDLYSILMSVSRITNALQDAPHLSNNWIASAMGNAKVDFAAEQITAIIQDLLQLKSYLDRLKKHTGSMGSITFSNISYSDSTFAFSCIVRTSDSTKVFSVGAYTKKAKKLNSPNLLSPADENSSTTPPTFSWQTNQSNVTGFRLSISSMNDMSNILIDTTITNAAVTSCQISNTQWSKLSTNINYYWSVRCLGENNTTSDWATPRTISRLGNKVTTPIISPPSGTFPPTIYSTITCATPGVTIRYSTDGTDPTTLSMLYENAISINYPDFKSNVTIKAKAWKDGYDPSDIAIVNYIYYNPPTDSVVIIGSGSDYDSKPFITMYEDAKTDIIYTKDEITSVGGSSGKITQIGFNFQMVQIGMNGFQIKMAHTSLPNLNAGLVSTNWTTVYLVGFYQPQGTGWQYINLQAPFEWNGTDNLLIEICFDNNTTSGTGSNVYVTHTTDVSMYSVYEDHSSGCSLTNKTGEGFAKKFHPNISLTLKPTNSPATPILKSPSNSSTNTDTNVVLEWNKSAGASSYRVVVSKESQFNLPIIDGNTSDTKYNLSGLENNTKYFWHVNASNLAGSSPWSETWNFTTAMGQSSTTLFYDDFNDGDFTNNPRWDFFPGGTSCWVTGTAEVLSGEFHILKSGTPGCGTGTQIEHSFNFNVTDSTKIIFDINPVFSDVGDGAGWTNEEYPAFVDLRLWNANNDSTDVRFCYNYRGGVSHKNGNLIFVVFSNVPQNVWQRNQLFRLRDYVHDAVRMSRIIIGGNGWNYEGRIDNIKITDVLITNIYNLDENNTPKNFTLEQNYPNPFNPSTKIRFDIPKQSFIKLVVYDILGREIEKLVDKEMLPGSYETTFDGRNLSNGVYFYRIEAGGFVKSSKMVLIK